MTEEMFRDPLPSSVSEYTIEYPGATPTQIMAELGVDEQYRAQLEYYCAVTRYTLFSDMEGCELAEDVHLKTVTWADVADWEIPAEECPPADLRSNDVVVTGFVSCSIRKKLRPYLYLIARTT